MSQWLAHNDARAGAAIAYYSIFSIGPLIVVAISIAALIFDREGVQSQVIDAIRSLLGDAAGTSIGIMLSGAGSKAEGVFAEVIGTVALVYAAINVVVQLKEAINRVWEVQSSSAVGVWGFVRVYVVSLAAVVALGFLLLTSMLLTAALAAFGRYVGSLFPVAFLQAASFGVSFAAISLLFALMFKWLPDAEVTWRAVWLGAIGTATLFEIGKYVIAFYIGKQGLESKYGAAASVVVVLIWVYYSARSSCLARSSPMPANCSRRPPRAPPAAKASSPGGRHSGHAATSASLSVAVARPIGFQNGDDGRILIGA